MFDKNEKKNTSRRSGASKSCLSVFENLQNFEIMKVKFKFEICENGLF